MVSSLKNENWRNIYGYLIIKLSMLNFLQTKNTMSTISKENYLKAIFLHNNLGENASTSKVANKLSVSNAAISDMAKKLSQEGLISYEKYQGMEFVYTESGPREQVTLKRLIYSFNLDDIVVLQCRRIRVIYSFKEMLNLKRKVTSMKIGVS